MIGTVFCLIFAVVSAFAQTAKLPPLDRYVTAPDPAYRYEFVETQSTSGIDVHLLEMTSQNWLTPQQVNRTEWRHWVVIMQPPKIDYTTGLLFIDGGSNNNSKPRVDPMLVNFARQTNSLVVQVRMVPNQPLKFAGDNRNRVEDQIISFGWDKYLRGGDDVWLARLPMTKAAVRAMDAATAYLSTKGIRLDKYVVAGASKRGWTTWSTGVVDSRVVAIIPLVIDLVNIGPSFRKQYQAYGRYSEAVQDYVDMGIMDRNNEPRMRELLGIEDPYSYFDRLTMPKYVVNASGDQYWLPDSSQLYFKDLKGTKHLRYVPNTDHALRNSDAAESVLAYYHAILSGKPLPKLEWKADKKGSLEVKATDSPGQVKVWSATNPEARDFRLEKIGPAFKSEPVTGDKGVYRVKVPKPAKGWTAYFVELTFPGFGKNPLKFTTDVFVVPQMLPFPPPGSSNPVK